MFVWKKECGCEGSFFGGTLSFLSQFHSLRLLELLEMDTACKKTKQKSHKVALKGSGSHESTHTCTVRELFQHTMTLNVRRQREREGGVRGREGEREGEMGRGGEREGEKEREGEREKGSEGG